MCGIAGYLDPDHQAVDLGYAQAMASAISHRGPFGSIEELAKRSAVQQQPIFKPRFLVSREAAI